MINQDLATFPQFNGFNPQHYFNSIKGLRRNLTEKGILTFPFDYGYKLQNTTEKYGKKIIPWGPWKNATASIKPYETRPHNYSVLTGKKNKFLVIDYDFPKEDEGEEDGLEWLKSILGEEHEFWNTYIVKTGSGGKHFYLKYDERINVGVSRCIYINNVRSKISLDLRTDNNCVIGEGSINEKGVYENFNGNIDNIKEIPNELICYLLRPVNPTNNLIPQNNIINPASNSNEAHTITEEQIKYINLFNGEEHLFNAYEEWFMLAKICSHYYNFNYFLNISQKASGFTSIQNCRELYESSKSQNCSFGVLVNFLKEKLPQKYDENFGYINKYIYNGDDEGFNQLIYHYYKDKFKYDADNLIWYECVEGLWFKRDKDNLVLKRLLADDFIKIFRKRQYFISQKLMEVQNSVMLSDDEKEETINKYEKFKEIIDTQIKWCRSNNKRANFVNSIKDMFYDYEFLNKLNSINYSGHLFSFNNGYIDMNEYLQNKEIIQFHRHKPENYISITCGYDYIPKAQIPTDYFEKLNKLMADILPEEMDCKYLIEGLSSCMTAGNQNEICITAYGKTGGNGKGLVLGDLMTAAFGDYSGTFKTENITGKKSIDPERASSGLANIMNCRYVYMSEPQKGEELNNDALKLLTGGDEICYRKLHENMIKAKPSFTMLLQTNNILSADSYDDAVWRRLKYIQFNQTFRQNPNLEKGEKQADQTLKKKFSKDLFFRQTFIHILLENFVENLTDTPNIIKYNDMARGECDFIQEWIDMNVEETTENDIDFMWNYNQIKFITFNEIKKRYKLWYKNEYDEDEDTKPQELSRVFKSKLSNWKKKHTTKLYERGFDNQIEPIRDNTNRHKKKNWGESYIGFKFINNITGEDTDEENDLDM